MFKDNKNNNKKTYKSFDSWLGDIKNSIDQFKEEVEKELAEQEASLDKKVYEPKGKPTVYRNFSGKKNVRELFPKKPNRKTQTIMDKRSHEGKVNSKGSIEGSTIMGREGDPVNPDLRRRLEEKRAKQRRENREQRQENYQKSQRNYMRKSTKTAEKREKIANFQKSLKTKDTLRKAILAAEVLAPPVSKRHKH